MSDLRGCKPSVSHVHLIALADELSSLRSFISVDDRNAVTDDANIIACVPH